MIEYVKACEIAVQYFENNLGISGLATATENDDFWFFSGGDPYLNMIGNEVISVSKKDGDVGYVDMLSDTGFETIRNSIAVGIPKKYIGSN